MSDVVESKQPLPGVTTETPSAPTPAPPPQKKKKNYFTWKNIKIVIIIALLLIFGVFVYRHWKMVAGLGLALGLAAALPFLIPIIAVGIDVCVFAITICTKTFKSFLSSNPAATTEEIKAAGDTATANMEQINTAVQTEQNVEVVNPTTGAIEPVTAELGDGKQGSLADQVASQESVLKINDTEVNVEIPNVAEEF